MPAPTSPHPAPVLLFDGVCNLCDSAVQFVLRHGRTGDVRFASLQSEVGQDLLRQAGLPPDYLASLVFVEGPRVWTASDAALQLARHLRRPWSLLAGLRVIPRWLRDPVYHLVARYRYRVFGKREACRLPTPEERARFLDFA